MLLNNGSEPSRSMQRWFGASLGGLFLLLAWLLGLTGIGLFAMLVIAACIPITYYAIPSSQVPIIRAWQIVTYPIAFVVSHILLAITFYFVFLPIGLLLRLTGYDPLQLRCDDETTAWRSREKTTDINRYFKQF